MEMELGYHMSAFERHYTVKEVAKMWSVSSKTVIRKFGKHPEVLKLGAAERMHKRKRIVLRIPESVVRRLWSQLIREP